MLKVKKLFVVSVGILALGGVSQASMLDQLIYNVAGQATNAAGARLGDEIYYGSSRGASSSHHKVHRKHRKKHISAPVMTNERLIQQSLTSLGFYHGRIDGQINSFETRTAIKDMNIAYGISNDASLQQNVRDTLIYLGTLFEFDRYLIAANSTNRAKNKKVQVALKIHGYYHSGIDGLLGGGSRNAIREYQMGSGLPATGALDYEAEYQLISSAKEKNDKNLNETINSLKSFGVNRPMQQTYQQHQPVQGYQQQAPVQQASQQQPVQQRYQQSQRRQVKGYQQQQPVQQSSNKVPQQQVPLEQVQATEAVKVPVQEKVPEAQIKTPTTDTSIPDASSIKMYTDKK